MKTDDIILELENRGLLETAKLIIENYNVGKFALGNVVGFYFFLNGYWFVCNQDKTISLHTSIDEHITMASSEFGGIINPKVVTGQSRFEKHMIVSYALRMASYVVPDHHDINDIQAVGLGTTFGFYYKLHDHWYYVGSSKYVTKLSSVTDKHISNNYCYGGIFYVN